MHQLVAGGSVAPHRLNFFDKVEKEKERQKTKRHKTHRAQDFAVNQSAQCFHVVAPFAMTDTDRYALNLRHCQLLCPLANQMTASTKTPPCKPMV